MTWIFVRLIFLVKVALSLPAPTETQHAVCKVFTKEIEATAKATITRQIKGVCSTRELNLRFDELYEELQQMKRALGLQESQSQYRSLESSVAVAKQSTTSDLPIDTDYDSKDENLDLKEEIVNFNDTIIESSDGDLFFYYWNILDIKKMLRKRDIYVTSPPISVLGHTLYMQFYPNYQNDYAGIVLKPDSNSFLKKHKIMFLGKNPTQNKISSKILYGVKNEDRIFKIESEMLDEFITTDSLLVKVKIYLNS